MSNNPDFVSQNDSNFTAIRYYTQFDPYYYVIDNRPLQDIETNLKSIRSGGSDAARRAAILNSLNLSGVLRDLYSAPSGVSSATKMVTGLNVSVPSNNLIRVSPGAAYELRGINVNVTDNVMKQALSLKSTDFTLTPPAGVGTSMVYTIEGEFVELTSSTLPSTQLPLLDATNEFLPSTIIQGELKLSLLAGTAAVTGSEVPAATTAGKFPLYNLTMTQGVINPRVWAHDNAPYIKGLNQSATAVAIPADNATLQVVNWIPTVTMSTTGTSSIIIPLKNFKKELNPFEPIRFKITFSSSSASGNLALRAVYKGFQSGESHMAAYTTGPIETVAVTGGANSIQTIATTTAVVPVSEIAGFVNNVWSVNKDYISIALQRVGDDAGDTNSGLLNLFEVVLFQ